MENILEIKSLEGMTKGDNVHAIAKVVSIQERMGKNDKSYYTGMISGSDGQIGFKIWSNASAIDTIGDVANAGKIIEFAGKIDDFNDTLSIIIEDAMIMDEVDESIIAEFAEKPYDINNLKTELTDIIKRNVTARGISVIKEFFADEDLRHRFEVEYAATSHHDNVMNGLMAHTLKVLKILEFKLSMYGLITFDADDGMTIDERRDLLFIGLLIHDIDKTNEMYYGVYQPLYSFVNHRVLGTIRISKLEDLIIDTYNESFYMHLLALVDQHHGEYGDPIQTIYSYIAHMCDDEDAKLTVVARSLQEPENSSSGPIIKVQIGDSNRKVNI